MEKWRVSHGVKEPYLFLGGLLSRPPPLLLLVFDGQPAFFFVIFNPPYFIC